MIASSLISQEQPPLPQDEPKTTLPLPATTVAPSAIDVATPNETPSLFDAKDYRQAIWKSLFFIGVVIFLALITLAILRKLGQARLFSGNSLRHVKILERRAISAKTVLYLLEIGGKQILVAESQLEVRALAQIDWPSPSA